MRPFAVSTAAICWDSVTVMVRYMYVEGIHDGDFPEGRPGGMSRGVNCLKLAQSTMK